jgi:hypothetical protein
VDDTAAAAQFVFVLVRHPKSVLYDVNNTHTHRTRSTKHEASRCVLRVLAVLSAHKGRRRLFFESDSLLFAFVVSVDTKLYDI